MIACTRYNASMISRSSSHATARPKTPASTNSNSTDSGVTTRWIASRTEGAGRVMMGAGTAEDDDGRERLGARPEPALADVGAAADPGRRGRLAGAPARGGACARAAPPRGLRRSAPRPGPGAARGGDRLPE